GAADDPAGVAKVFAAEPRQEFGESGDGNFGSFGADVIGLAGVTVEERLVVTDDSVGHVAERAGGRAVRKQHEIAAGEKVAGEVRQDTTIGDFEAGSVVVERTGGGNPQAELTGEVHAEGFTVTFRFVVAGARSGA